MHPEPVCLDDVPLEEKLKSTSRELRDRLCQGKEHLSEITYDLKLRVRNYNDYWQQINEITARKNLHSASIEMCMIYLTFLCRADYHEGGYPDFWHKHREEVRAIRRRILDLLFEE